MATVLSQKSADPARLAGLCQICSATSLAGSPVPLCERCLLKAYRYVRGCIAARSIRPDPSVELLKGIRRAREDEGSVYYLRIGDRVKIGTSLDPPRRVRSLALPRDALAAVEPGGPALERKRHEQFGHLRVGLEWFRAAPELLDHIESLCADTP